ncbi:MAG: hypothetical protein QXR26_05605 [Candidatus Caldarchaeum sp.]
MVNSLIATIPPELSQRFLIREGQEYIIMGMSRMNPDFRELFKFTSGSSSSLKRLPSWT